MMSIPSYRWLRKIWLLPNIVSPDGTHEFLPSFEEGQSLDVLAEGLGDWKDMLSVWRVDRGEA